MDTKCLQSKLLLCQLNDPQQRGNEKKALEVMREAYPPAKELDDSRRSASQVCRKLICDTPLLSFIILTTSTRECSPPLTWVHCKQETVFSHSSCTTRKQGVSKSSSESSCKCLWSGHNTTSSKLQLFLDTRTQSSKRICSRLVRGAYFYYYCF